ncbi:MAG TPA: hypothetical protein VMC09_03805 [Anaerolineales bacterium]|nr:hypothetical protein [Anaerolineales bacterium]
MTRSPSTRLLKQFGLVLLLAFALSACDFSLPLPVQTPVIQTVQVTQVVTQLATQEVTREITRVVEVPVTVTPSLTPVFSPIPTLSPNINPFPSITPTPEPVVVTVTEHTTCLYGPGSVYLYKTEFAASTTLEVIGRNLDGSWLYVQNMTGWKNPCWLDAIMVRINTGDLATVPVTYSMLLYSNQYQPPVANATRAGSVVTVFWTAVSMAKDDYRGYLVEAWVCQGGTQVFVPIGYVPAYDQNKGVMGINVTDEPGCLAPSSARIYSVEKHGYSQWRKIDWPQAEAATPTP